ncbi:MAG: TonB-dependent receptor [Thiotrichaceae bacterium]
MKKKLLAIVISSVVSGALAESTEAADVLDEIFVTATRYEINTAEAPGSVTVINHEEIERKGGENIRDIIRGTAGVSLQGIGSGGRKALSLRGMESKHTLVLVDGKRIPASNDAIGPNTDYQYDWVSLGKIERIEIVRGPMSVLYGSDALGGVINIITRKPGKDLAGVVKLTGRVADDAGADGHNIEFNIDGSVSEKMQFRVGGQQSRGAAVESVLNPGLSAIEGRKKQQLSLDLSWQPVENHDIKFEYTNGQEDRWFDTSSRRVPNYRSSYDIDRQQVSLGWKGKYGATQTFLRTYQSSVDIVNHATNGVTPTASQTLQDTVVEGNINFPLGEKQFFTVGLEHRTEKLENTRLAGGEDDFTLNSIYLQDEIDLSDDVLITLGARLDDHEVFGNEVSPRASIVWKTTDKLTLKGSYGHGFRAPTIKQVSPGYSFPLGIFLITSNPDLKPETNDALELGANYSTEKFSINTSLFDNKVKNLIDTRFDAFLPGGVIQRWTYDNVDEARIKGAEISTKIEIGKRFSLNGSYQYLDATDGSGQRLERRPRHTVSAGLGWEKKGWRFNLNAEHLADQIIEQTRVLTDVPDYTLWNVGVRKAINKHLDIAVGIENLTDVRLEDKSPAFRHEEYPRTLRLEVKVGF